MNEELYKKELKEQKKIRESKNQKIILPQPAAEWLEDCKGRGGI